MTLSDWTGIEPFQLRSTLLLASLWMLGAWNVLVGVFILEPDSGGLIHMENTVRGTLFPMLPPPQPIHNSPGAASDPESSNDVRLSLSLATTLMFVGWMFGSAAWSTLADRYGRRRVGVINCLALILTVLLESQAKTSGWFLFCRFLLGINVGGFGVISYVWGTEWSTFRCTPQTVGGRNVGRAGAIGGTMFQILWSVGGVILPLLAWLVPYWRSCLLLIGGLTTAVGAAVLLAVPESPKWLKSQRLITELTQLETNIRQFNNQSRHGWRRVSEDFGIIDNNNQKDFAKEAEDCDDDKEESGSSQLNNDRRIDDNGSDEIISIDYDGDDEYINGDDQELAVNRSGQRIAQYLGPLSMLFKRRTLPITVAFAILWFSNAFLYYGLVLNVNRLPGNVYLLSSLMSLLCIPGQLLSVPAANRLGIRLALLAGLALVGGLFSTLALLTAFTSDEAPWLSHLSVTVSLLGQFVVNMTFTLCYRITAQTFPTAVRSTAVGFCVMAGRVGAMLCPVVVMLGTSTSSGSMGLPGMIILALVSCTATITFSKLFKTPP